MILGVIQRNGTGGGIHGSLGSGIQHIPRLGHQAVDGGNVDDAAAAPGLHPRYDFPHTAQAAEIIGFQQPEHILVLVIRRRAMTINTHRGNQHINAAAVPEHAIQKRLGLVGFCQIHQVATAVRANLLQLFLCGSYIILIASAKVYGRSLLCKEQGNALANAPGCRGNQYLFSLQQVVIIGNGALIQGNVSHISVSFF